MALLTILEYPDPRLRTKARPVTAFDAELRQRIEDMFETMYAAPGIGLAASQIDWHHQLIVMDLTEDRSGRQVFINPEILSKEGSAAGEEGCLSVPGIYDDVPRAERISARWQDADGQWQQQCPFQAAAHRKIEQGHGRRRCGAHADDTHAHQKA